MIDPVENGNEEERRQMERQMENEMARQKEIHPVSQHAGIKKDRERKVIKMERNKAVIIF